MSDRPYLSKSCLTTMLDRKQLVTLHSKGAYRAGQHQLGLGVGGHRLTILAVWDLVEEAQRGGLLAVEEAVDGGLLEAAGIGSVTTQ